jgi:hypothetical protein
MLRSWLATNKDPALTAPVGILPLQTSGAASTYRQAVIAPIMASDGVRG